MSDREWVVDIKGGPNQKCWEIAVIHKDYAHGFSSYGCFGQSKRLIGHSGGPCDDAADAYVWSGLVKLANEYAIVLNGQLKVDKP